MRLQSTQATFSTQTLALQTSQKAQKNRSGNNVGRKYFHGSKMNSDAEPKRFFPQRLTSYNHSLISGHVRENIKDILRKREQEIAKAILEEYVLELQTIVQDGDPVLIDEAQSRLDRANKALTTGQLEDMNDAINHIKSSIDNLGLSYITDDTTELPDSAFDENLGSEEVGNSTIYTYKPGADKSSATGTDNSSPSPDPQGDNQDLVGKEQPVDLKEEGQTQSIGKTEEAVDLEQPAEGGEETALSDKTEEAVDSEQPAEEEETALTDKAPDTPIVPTSGTETQLTTDQQPEPMGEYGEVVEEEQLTAAADQSLYDAQESDEQDN